LPCPAGRSVPGRGGPERPRRPRPDRNPVHLWSVEPGVTRHNRGSSRTPIEQPIGRLASSTHGRFVAYNDEVIILASGSRGRLSAASTCRDPGASRSPAAGAYGSSRELTLCQSTSSVSWADGGRCWPGEVRVNMAAFVRIAEVRGSNPLSSTSTDAVSWPRHSARCQQITISVASTADRDDLIALFGTAE
jgi:hypothetical protein